MPTHPAGPPTPEPREAGALPPDQFDRWYGGWDPLDPTTVAAFMDGFERPWWVVGGWSIEVFTGVHRPHQDMDVSILSGDVAAFREFLGDRWTAWNVDEGWFRPLDERFTDVRPASQAWVRRDARSPWVLDVPFSPQAPDGRWTYKRHSEVAADLEEVTWVAPDGLRYQRPEVTLLFKFAQERPQDLRDASTTLPLLDRRARAWLRDALATAHPGHRWVDELA